MIPLNYHHLYYFYVIAAEGGVTKACSKLYLAQSTLSSQLRELEKALGQRLFWRQGRKLRLTPEGQHVLAYAERIFALGSELMGSLPGAAQQRGRELRVGATEGLARAYVNSYLLVALRSDTGRRVTFKDGPLVALAQELLDYRLDVLLTDVPPTFPGRALDWRTLGDVQVAVVAAPPLAKELRAAFPKSLDGAPFILPVSSHMGSQVVEWLAEQGIYPRIVAEVADQEVARRLALAGAGVVALNLHSLAASEPQGALVPVGELLPFRQTIYCVTRQGKGSGGLAQRINESFAATAPPPRRK